MPEATPTKKPARLQHVIAHRTVHPVDGTDMDAYDEIRVFGQEIDALRAIVGAPDWVYASVAHGQSFKAALKAVGE